MKKGFLAKMWAEMFLYISLELKQSLLEALVSRKLCWFIFIFIWRNPPDQRPESLICRSQQDWSRRGPVFVEQDGRSFLWSFLSFPKLLWWDFSLRLFHHISVQRILDVLRMAFVCLQCLSTPVWWVWTVCCLLYTYLYVAYLSIGGTPPPFHLVSIPFL